MNTDPYDILSNARKEIEEYVVDQRSREEHAEVHTPFHLIEEMLSKVPDEEWSDPEKTFCDPCSGIGNFPVVVAENLMETLKDEFPDPEERYRHIMENQIFMIEIQLENAIMIEKLLNPTGELNLNLKCVDALELDVEHMDPEDWKEHRFRTNYKGKNFFEYEPSPEEVEKLEKAREVIEKTEVLKSFERGY